MLNWEHKEAFGQNSSLCPKCGAFALYKYYSATQIESNFCPSCGVQLKPIENKSKSHSI